MPVTAKLSRKFYDTFGDEVANELVDWFNQVDAGYRGSLRELNELNFARFDAKVEQRFAESEARTELRFAAFERKYDARLAEIEKKFDARFIEFEKKVDARFADLELRLERRFSAIDGRFEQLRADLIKWMFIFWAGTTFTILGAMFAIVRL